MIANVEYNTGGRSGMAKYIRYLLSPKKTAGIEKSSDTERVMAFKCSDGRKSPKTKEEIRATVENIADKIIEHNENYKRGKRWKGDKHALMGEVSFSLKDSHLTPEDAMLIVEQNLRNTMGGSREYVMVCHADSDCLHVHFVVSTVDAVTGQYYNPSNVKQPDGLTYQRQRTDDWELELERTELAYGLERVKQREGVARLEERQAHARGDFDFVSDRHVEVKQISHKAHQKLKRGLDIAEIPELDLRQQFLLAYQESGGDGKDFDTLLDNLEARGIRVVPNMGTEKVRGLAIGFANEPVEHSVGLSTYGTKYGWKKLSQEFNYDNQQHRDRLAQLRIEANASTANSHTLGTPLQDLDPTNSAVANIGTSETSGLEPVELATGRHHESAIKSEAYEEGTGRVGLLGRVAGEPSTGDRTAGRPDRSNKHVNDQINSRLEGVALSNTSDESRGLDQGHTSIDGAGPSNEQDHSRDTEARTVVGLHENNGHHIGDNGSNMRGGGVDADGSTVAPNTGAVEDSVQSVNPTGQGSQSYLHDDEVKALRLERANNITRYNELADEVTELNQRIHTGRATEFWNGVPPQTLQDRADAINVEATALLARREALAEVLQNYPEPVMVPAGSTIDDEHVENEFIFTRTGAELIIT